MKKAAMILLTLSIVAIVILLFLFQSATLPNKNNNGFSRKWINESIKEQFSSKLLTPVTNISGLSGNGVYLSGTTPFWSLVYSKDLILKDTIRYRIPRNKGNYIPSTIWVDSPNVYIHCKNMGATLSGNLDTNMLSYHKLPINVFTRSAQLSADKVLIRSFAETGMDQTFKIININDNSIFQESRIFNDSVNAILHDGFIKWDNATKTILYLEKYSNKLLRLDSNLNVLYEKKTIDTISTGNTELSILSGSTSSKLMPANSRVLVNKEVFIGNGKVYVVSALRGDNETARDFNDYDPVDVYNLSTGSYISSFKLPAENRNKLISIAADNSMLYVLYKNNIVGFPIPKI